MPSLPSRGAWIEILTMACSMFLPIVAPLAGSVDRNNKRRVLKIRTNHVAPLAGSVDRNHWF